MTFILITILTHEYTLAMYGVLAWQLERFFRSKKNLKEYHKGAWRELGQALVWIGIVIVFDDELLAKYNEWAEIDYAEPVPWMYIAAGFFITLLRTKIGKQLGIDNNQDQLEAVEK